ncbi:hypothetical protein BPAE_0215g00170 [Botrytis paeoniae]|uniref:Uncharacterized protein n=1 Tax=Botrytis paeoniae TaxID=278948 RepID=A0A4Z1FAC6_9HELO|nr:hypothetical protein BPAE_0215g00170 [Botrytis paeoniae]
MHLPNPLSLVHHQYPPHNSLTPTPYNTPPTPSSPSKTLPLKILTSSTGLSSAPVFTSPILFTVPIPLVTRPKIVCFPSNHGVGANVIKNCDPFVFGPEFAIDNIPAPVCFNAGRFDPEGGDNGCSAASGASGITGLEHEVGNYAVEDYAVVVAPADESLKVGAGFGGVRGVEFEGYGALREGVRMV